MYVALAAVVAALFLSRLVLLGVLHVQQPAGYSPIKNAVSEYAIGPTERLSRCMSWITVPAWAALAAAVWFGLPDWEDRAWGTTLLVILAVIFLLLPTFPTDPIGAALTSRGRVHYLLAIGWFAITYSLTGNLSRLADDSWSAAAGVGLQILHWLALAALIALVATLVVKRGRRIFGLCERVFIVTINIFYLWAAIELMLH